MLNRLVVHNDQLPLHPSSLTRFHSRAAPQISVLSYLRRISKYTSLEKVCCLILLIYIDRISVTPLGAHFTVCSLTVHRFVCSATACASKALCDAFSTNGHYAKVGGVSLIEMNMLEKEFLNLIGWNLSVSADPSRLSTRTHLLTHLPSLVAVHWCTLTTILHVPRPFPPRLRTRHTRASKRETRLGEASPDVRRADTGDARRQPFDSSFP
jgi:Cyclin